MSLMACPHCVARTTRVVRTTKAGTKIVRLRECPNGHRFDTVEQIVPVRGQATPAPGTQNVGGTPGACFGT